MQRLGNLIVIWDDNGITIDGAVSLSDTTDQLSRFEASGWSVFSCDGHDPDAIDRAIAQAKQSPLPSMIDCKTHIGFGSPSKQDTAAAHGAPMGDEEITKIRVAFSWPHAAFEIPADVLSDWRETGARGQTDSSAWAERRAALSASKQAEFDRVIAGDAPKKLSAAIKAFKKKISEEAPKMATRKSSEAVLAVINSVMPETIGGSADLTGSNNTYTEGLGVFDESNRKGRYINYGIREHGMGSRHERPRAARWLRPLRRHVHGVH